MYRLSPKQAKALSTLWEESTRIGELVDAPVFRDRYKDWRLDLDRLCTLRLIALEDDRYRLTPLGLLQLDDPQAREIIQLGDAIGARLRKHFADLATRKEALKVIDLAQQLNVKPEYLAFCLRHLQDALIAWCDSFTPLFESADAVLFPAKRIMDHSSLAEVAEQLERWARDTETSVDFARGTPPAATAPSDSRQTNSVTLETNEQSPDSGLKGKPPEIIEGIIWIFRWENWKQHPGVATLTLVVMALLLFELLPKESLVSRDRREQLTPSATLVEGKTDDGASALAARQTPEHHQLTLKYDPVGLAKGATGGYTIKGTNLQLVASVRYLGTQLPMHLSPDLTSLTVDSLPPSFTASAGKVPLEILLSDGSRQPYEVTVK